MCRYWFSADFALVAVDFLRRFDCADHDIARSVSEFEAFEEVVLACFVEGKALRGARAPGEEFITDIARRHTRRRCVFRAGESHIQAFGTMTEQVEQELSTRSKLVAQNSLERVRTELHDTSLRVNSQCFDLARARLAYTDCQEEMVKPLERSLVKFAQTLGCDPQAALRDYRDSINFVLAAHAANIAARASNVEPENVDYRLAWCALLSSEPAVVCPGRFAPFKPLKCIVRFLMSIEDGECSVERDIASMLRTAREHSLRGNCAAARGAAKRAFLLNALLVRRDPCMPKERKELVADEKPTDILWRTSWLWRGRKNFGVAQHRLAAGKGWRRPDAADSTTWKGVKRRALAAASPAGQACTMPLLKPLPLRMSFAAGREGLVHSGMRANQYWNPQHEKFLQGTVKKARAGPDARPAVTQRPAGPPMPSLSDVAQVSRTYTDPDGGASPDGVALATHAHASRDAQLVIIDRATDLFGQGGESFLIHLIYIVGLGKPVVCRAAWTKAGADPKRVGPGHVIWHRAACQGKVVKFRCGVGLDAQLKAALRHVAASPASKWTIAPNDAAANRTETDVVLNDAGALLAWMRQARRVINSIGARAWTGNGLRLGKL